MKKCLICNEVNTDDQETCTNCGTTFTLRRSYTKKQSLLKLPIYLLAAAVIVIIILTGYLILENKYGKEATTEQFISALIAQDKDTLQELIKPKDTRIAIDEESIQALLHLVKKNPSIVQVAENNLLKESEDGMFSLRAAGKRFGLFPRYTINPAGYIMKVKSLGEETVLALHDAEIGYIKKRDETAEFGPFLAGIYPIQMTTTIDEELVQEEIQANVFGAKQTIQLSFDSVEELAAEAKENESTPDSEATVQNDVMPEQSDEPVIIKEVIKEVPSGVYQDQFIISYSGDVFLDKSDLNGLSKEDLRLARNEIFARHGYMFKSKDLQNYFGSQSWYEPNPDFDGKLAEWEKHNIQLIKSYE
ncbi:hypothetical protein SporoP37_12440 [Sporosarcina sp. P37]|uniref:YARHG domain-containing protein n=1 Tax=unclassified Sporosarcina TaxID=2647733 RepID=UPI000A17D743|nr:MULTISPECIES: YARHG domain-containing protein [unclassified Sporosarcina]ARK25385.1 hypothetical protein SporoP37_12440 [Sporosarcina sp. P37]PID19062.1 YARHG domain-containing protein [Sporosarcina sp. P35]